MDKIPPYITAGLQHVFLNDDNQVDERQSFLQRFEEKWGGLQHANLLMAINNGQEDEIAFAIAALYALDKVGSHALLVDLLAAANMWRQWSSCIVLAGDSDPSAFPLLGELLTSCLTEEIFLHQNNNADYYVLNWSFLIPSLLSSYKSPSIAPIIRRSIEKCEMAYIYIQQNYGVIDDGVYYSVIGTVEYMQFLLLYLAGRLATWGVCAGITFDKSRSMLWMLIQAIAAEHGKIFPKLADDLKFYFEMTQYTRKILTGKFGLTHEEQEMAIRELNSNDFYKHALNIELTNESW